MKVILREIAYARSGDKGNSANIGLIAYREEGYAYLKEMVTPEFVTEAFSGLCPKEVVRYELDNLLALNFVLKGSLGGGGASSLFLDSQGKTFGQRLLDTYVEVPDSLIEKMRRHVH